MSEDEHTGKPPESLLCIACGLCCTGHLFSWVRLNASELDASEKLGLNVIRSDPRQRGFTQPCPLWRGVCPVYDSPHYPRGCRKYRCKLLKLLSEGNIPLSESLEVVQQAMDMIRDMEAFLPVSPNVSFRERLIARMEQKSAGAEFQSKAGALLEFFDAHFGVNDFFDRSERA